MSTPDFCLFVLPVGYGGKRLEPSVFDSYTLGNFFGVDLTRIHGSESGESRKMSGSVSLVNYEGLFES